MTHLLDVLYLNRSIFDWASNRTPTQLLIGNEKNTMCYIRRVCFYFNIIYCPIRFSIPNLIFSLFPSMTAKTCSGSLVLCGCGVKNSLIGAQVLVGAHLSFQSHQFIYNVLECVYADGILAF